MQLTSTAFEHEGEIPRKYSCDGAGVNPPLRISELPQGVRSLALVVEDPDAPGGTFVHWTMWNIDETTTEIEEDSVPEGAVQGRTSAGTGYVPPCPPSGSHRYYFRAYALNTVLSLAPDTDKDQLLEAMEGAVLESAELMGTYERG